MSCLKWLKGLFSKPKLKFRKEYQFNDDFSKDAKDSSLNNIETPFPLNKNNGRIYPRETFYDAVLKFNKKKIDSNKKITFKGPVINDKNMTSPKRFTTIEEQDNEHEN